MNGDGVPQSYAGAAKYFSVAARQGHAEAAYHLALLFDSPLLGPADARAAARYMTAAALAGHAPAYAAMGLIVHRGDADGVAADWFERGARLGDPQSTLLYAVALSRGDGRAKDIAAAAGLARQLAAAPSTPAPIRAQAERLRRTLDAARAGPISLRD
jgi:TPR repeat protein